MTTSTATNQCKAGEGHLVIHPDGRTEFITQVELGVDGRQAIVGGRFDCVYLEPGLDMWIHDEGKFLCDLNPVATALFQQLTGRDDDTIWGTVVLSSVDDEGASLPIPAAKVGHLREEIEFLAWKQRLQRSALLLAPQSVNEDTCGCSLGRRCDEHAGSHLMMCTECDEDVLVDESDPFCPDCHTCECGTRYLAGRGWLVWSATWNTGGPLMCPDCDGEA